VVAIKERHPNVEVCTSLGLLTTERAQRLLDIGVYAYNHNLNTSEANYGEICSTHTFADRVETVGVAQGVGLSPCSGAIFGMDESDKDIVDLAIDLRQLNPDSVPINFLIPFEGTPLSGKWQLTPQRCLRILALYRFYFPDVEVRIAGGREIHLRTLQTLGLHLANSIFLGDYLTSEGQEGMLDFELIADAGFVVEGVDEVTLPNDRHELVTLRRRGSGTEIPANV
jgi:biotin synthase